MSCGDKVCGTGGSNLPQPGDPGNSLLIQAASAYGGIAINITYPSVNPYAIAYLLLYRSDTNDFGSAIELLKIGGEYYFDPVDSGKIYYYWVRTVSIYGTQGDPVGPASAEAKPKVDDIFQQLAGMIDASLLGQALHAQIAMIPTLDINIAKEINDRLASNKALSDALAAVQTNLDTALTYVNQEITARRDGDTALVDSLNQIAAGVSGNAAAITTEQQVRATKDSALASSITALEATTGQNKAAIDSEVKARTDADTALASSINSVSAAVGQNTSAIQTEQQARASGDSTLAQSINTLQTTYDNKISTIQTVQKTLTDNDAAQAQSIQTLQSQVGSSQGSVQQEAETRANADNALGQQITTVQSTLNGNISQVQQTLQASINSVDGKAGALYTLKLNSNGLIGGFGAYNNGQTIQVAFDVDSFSIGRYGAGTKPFIVDTNGIVYIDKARIRDADIDTLKIGGNAVTVPVTSVAYNIAANSGGGATVWINSTGQPIIIIASSMRTGADSSNDLGNGFEGITISRNGTVIWSGNFSSTGGNGAATGALVDQPGAGTYHYDVTRQAESGAGTARCSISIIEAKR